MAPLALTGGFSILAAAILSVPAPVTELGDTADLSPAVRASERANRSGERPSLIKATASARMSAAAETSAIARVSPSLERSAQPSATPSPRVTPSNSSAKTRTAKTQAAVQAKKTAQAKRTQAIPALAATIAKRYTTAGINVRQVPTTSSPKVTSLAAGHRVRITRATSDGWQQINLNGNPGWVLGKYLTRKAPVSQSSSSGNGSSGSSGSVSSSACASSAVERGLQSSTIAVHRALCNAFPGISGYGGQRGGGGDHASGRALDVMVSGSNGQAVANYVRANAGRLGVTEVIHAQRIWTTQRASEGWRSMSDRGSATANHYDHVHVSVR